MHAIKCGNVDNDGQALYRSSNAASGSRWRTSTPIPGPSPCRTVASTFAPRPRPRSTPDMTRAQVAEVRAQWLKPHDRALYPTKCAGVEFDPGADCPEWRAFLELILPDAEVRDCFHRSMGVTLFGKNEPQCVFLFRGVGRQRQVNRGQRDRARPGREPRAMRSPAGSKCSSPRKTKSAGKATPEEVDFPGARVLIASEPSPTDELIGEKDQGPDRRRSAPGARPRTCRSSTTGRPPSRSCPSTGRPGSKTRTKAPAGGWFSSPSRSTCAACPRTSGARRSRSPTP